MNPNDTLTTCTDHENAAEFLLALEPGDRVEVSRWANSEPKTGRVISTKTNDDGVPFVTVRGLSLHGSTTLKPSSGYKGSCVVTHGRGMGSHYGRVEVVAQDIEAHRPEDDDEDDGAECPYCGSADLKEGAAVEDGKTFDYGCRSCRRVFDAEPVLVTDGGEPISTSMDDDDTPTERYSPEVEDLLDDTDADVPESGMTVEVLDGEKVDLVEDGGEATDKGERYVFDRSEAWSAGLRNVWSDLADRVDEADLDEGSEVVYAAVPGWYANLDDNDEIRATLQRLGWDGFDGAVVRGFFVRDTEGDEGKGSYKLTRVWDPNRESWAGVAGQYGMIWPARSCSTLVRVHEGEPTPLDREPLRLRDGARDDDGLPSDEDADLELMVAKARRRVLAAQSDADESEVQAAMSRLADRPDAITEKGLHGLLAARRTYERLTGDDDVPDAVDAAFLLGFETALDHTPAPDEDE